ncbi:hypothetical protein C2845_PM06G28430 [Panicum miliaceum]|uniref:Uncharacterized protein n=1 Tax=Panicum miliaceum TaxID=4540 RepID=A0A3L6RAR7_PANMI|nr:hypothetical protein C2845_PM06G28430 [Panicum miliaceum]
MRRRHNNSKGRPAAEQVIEEDNMLQAFDIIELNCKCLIENAAKLDMPQECGEDIREAAAGIMFAARWCGDLPELLLARTILEDKFGTDFAVAAKEDYSKTHKSSINKFVDPMHDSTQLEKETREATRA